VVLRLTTGTTPVRDLVLVNSAGQTVRVLAGSSIRNSVAPCDAGPGVDPASWSPNGRWLAFSGQSQRDPNAAPGALGCDIYRIGVDGTGLRRLTATGSAVKPVWSPSNRQIVFSVVERRELTGRYKGLFSETARLWTMNPDGSSPRPLESGSVGAEDLAGAFTPDGSKLLFTRAGRYPTVMRIDATGGDPRRVIRDGADPAVSPDARSIAFDSLRAGKGRICPSQDFCRHPAALFVARSDGGHQRRLVGERKADELSPSFSPDGRVIAYVRGETFEAAECTSIWRVPSSGGQARPLLADRACNTWYSDPVWRP
jgi:Tol biopolymer transport system component